MLQCSILQSLYSLFPNPYSLLLMSVTGSKSLRSTFLKFPQPLPSNHCCCVKTCVEIQAPSLNSTAKSYTKQKLLDMICSLEKQYNQELESKEVEHEERVRYLQNTIQSIKQEQLEFTQKSLGRTIPPDRQKELLEKIEQLEAQRANIVSNKVSYIQTNLTKKIHSLEHQLQCQQHQSAQQIATLKTQIQQLTANHSKQRSASEEQKERLSQQHKRLVSEIEQGKGEIRDQESKIKELEKEKGYLSYTNQSLKKELQKLESDWKQRYQEEKERGTGLGARCEELLEERSKRVQSSHSEKLEFQRKSFSQEMVIKEGEYKNQTLTERVHNLEEIKKQLEEKIGDLGREAERRDKDRESLWAGKEREFKEGLEDGRVKREQAVKELDRLKTEGETKDTNYRMLKQEMTRKQEEWNKQYKLLDESRNTQIESLQEAIVQLENHIAVTEKELKECQQAIAEGERVSLQPPQKEYVYIEKIVHSEEGRVAIQKYLSLTKQYLALETSSRNLEVQNKKLQANSNYYKELESAFDEERERWSKEREEMRQRGHRNQGDLYTWTVERIIHAENNHEGVRLENNVKIIPNQHLPNVSYVVVSSQDQLKEHIKSREDSRVARSRSMSKEKPS